MTRHQHGARRYPRSARVNEVLREVIAEEVERLSDPRLELVTVTGVEVSGDLHEATVYYSALGSSDEAAGGLRSAASHLRAVLGREVRMKYLPRLSFREDPGVVQGRRVDEIIRDLHHVDPTGENSVTQRERSEAPLGEALRSESESDQ